jgi:hypothetical protein
VYWLPWNCHAKLWNLHGVAITSHKLFIINIPTLFITHPISHGTECKSRARIPFQRKSVDKVWNPHFGPLILDPVLDPHLDLLDNKSQVKSYDEAPYRLSFSIIYKFDLRNPGGHLCFWDNRWPHVFFIITTGSPSYVSVRYYKRMYVEKVNKINTILKIKFT